MDVTSGAPAIHGFGTVTARSPQERHARMQEWRQVFAAPYHRATGKRKNGQVEWHVFSYRGTRALNGARAQAAYGEEATRWDLRQRHQGERDGRHDHPQMKKAQMNCLECSPSAPTVLSAT